MSDWQRCEDIFVDDVIRWDEPIWAAPTKKRGKPDAIGQQRVTAKIMAVGDVIELQVTAAEQMSLADGITEAPMKVKAGDRIRRKLSSLAAGDCHKRA